MDLGLDGRVAWLLGASSGLGLATARALAREGALVAISARTEPALEVAADAMRSEGWACTSYPLDVRDRDAVATTAERIAAELGPITILVSNAGGPPPGGFDGADRAALDAAGELDRRRADQQVEWMWRVVRDRLLDRLQSDPGVRDALPDVERAVRNGELTPTLAAQRLLDRLGI